MYVLCLLHAKDVVHLENNRYRINYLLSIHMEYSTKTTFFIKFLHWGSLVRLCGYQSLKNLLLLLSVKSLVDHFISLSQPNHQVFFFVTGR